MKLELLKTSAIATGVALAMAALGAQAATQPGLSTAGASSSAKFTGYIGVWKFNATQSL